MRPGRKERAAARLNPARRAAKKRFDAQLALAKAKNVVHDPYAKHFSNAWKSDTHYLWIRSGSGWKRVVP